MFLVAFALQYHIICSLKIGSVRILGIFLLYFPPGPDCIAACGFKRPSVASILTDG